ncbi:MAG: hypothetical protein ACPGRT_01940, partial [Flavobacteriaceae bacterium]
RIRRIPCLKLPRFQQRYAFWQAALLVEVTLPVMRLQLAEYALKIYKDLGFKGATRSEFIIRDGVAYLLEVNTTPGLTEQSILPQQARCAGISEASLFDRLINDAL